MNGQPVRIAMISQAEAEIPDWAVRGVREAGLELACRCCRSTEELLEFAADAEILWMTGANPCLTAAALDSLPHCRALFRSGSGMDSMPCARATELGIRLYNTPESISESVAEHACALLLACIRRIPQFDRDVRQGLWSARLQTIEWHLSRRTLGLVGYGLIGRNVAKMLSGFDLRVLHHDPGSDASVELDTLLRESDYVSLHCPLTPQTRHLISRRELALMKQGALLINTSRGAVVDEEALYEALSTHHLGGAALDVLSEEPPPAGHPLLTLENVILSPHLAAFSSDFTRNFWQYSVEKLQRIARDCRG